MGFVVAGTTVDPTASIERAVEEDSEEKTDDEMKYHGIIEIKIESNSDPAVNYPVGKALEVQTNFSSIFFKIEKTFNIFMTKCIFYYKM